jgi:uncharacterized protein (TIGR02391 family)
MTRKPVQEPQTPPTLTPQRAIELIRRQLEALDQVFNSLRNSPEKKKWITTTEAVLVGAFGDPSDILSKFKNVRSVFYHGRPEQYYEMEHRKDLSLRRAVMESAIEQLEILAPPSARVAPGSYHFHVEIERVSGALFRDGHYTQAALAAYIRVIEEVKVKSGLALDGDNLMNQAFGSAGGRVPVIAFNSLSTEAEKDEQTGLMFLFKGMIGLRNSKAHSNRLFNDPLRAHDYLSLASLLIRLLD